jgi:hypothetical protein
VLRPSPNERNVGLRLLAARDEASAANAANDDDAALGKAGSHRVDGARLEQASLPRGTLPPSGLPGSSGEMCLCFVIFVVLLFVDNVGFS